MTDFVQNVALDGVNDFTLATNTYAWSDVSFGAVSGFFPTIETDTYTINMTGSGSWQLRAMTFNESTTITYADVNDGGVRRINFLRLGESGATLRSAPRGSTTSAGRSSRPTASRSARCGPRRSSCSTATIR
jgi:hypothetical protein